MGTLVLGVFCATELHRYVPIAKPVPVLLHIRDLNHVPPRNLPLVHHLVDLGQILQRGGLERRLDEPAGEEVDRLGRVSPVPDVRALDGDHLDDGLEDGGFEEGAGGEADGDDGAAGPDVLGGLLEGFLVDGDEEDGVGAEVVGSGGLDVFDHVVGFGEVDEGLERGSCRYVGYDAGRRV